MHSFHIPATSIFLGLFVWGLKPTPGLQLDHEALAILGLEDPKKITCRVFVGPVGGCPHCPVLPRVIQGARLQAAGVLVEAQPPCLRIAGFLKGAPRSDSRRGTLRREVRPRGSDGQLLFEATRHDLADLQKKSKSAATEHALRFPSVLQAKVHTSFWSFWLRCKIAAGASYHSTFDRQHDHRSPSVANVGGQKWLARSKASGLIGLTALQSGL